MDKLTDAERAEAWQAIWNPTFIGIAILDKDLNFRSANPQFFKLLGIQPSDLINKALPDLTTIEYRQLTKDNCKLMEDGYADFYLLPKSYHFPHQNAPSKVLELINRVPASGGGNFQFFVSMIMKEELSAASSTIVPDKSKRLGAFLISIVDFMMTYGKWLAAIGTILATIAVAIIEGR